jgi:CRP-like cAMP-binding protein
MLNRYGEEMTLAKGTKIYCEGDTVNFFCYVVVKGQVRLLGDRKGVYREYEKIREKDMKIWDGDGEGIMESIDKRKFKEDLLCLKGDEMEIVVLGSWECFGEEDVVNCHTTRASTSIVDSAECVIFRIDFDL